MSDQPLPLRTNQPDSTGSSDAPQRMFRTRVELQCLLCARELGVLESASWPAYGRLVLYRTGLPAVLVDDWRRLRCAVCDGAAMPAEILTRPVRIETPIDWSSERPRRGRPPKRQAN